MQILYRYWLIPLPKVIKQMINYVYDYVQLYCLTGNVTAKVGSIGFLPRWLPKSIIPMAIIKYDEDLGTPIRDEKGFCIRCEFGKCIP